MWRGERALRKKNGPRWKKCLTNRSRGGILIELCEGDPTGWHKNVQKDGWKVWKNSKKVLDKRGRMC